MKACTKCNKDIPDSAMHCVFCGEKQSAEAGTAKTMMGYAGMAQDVLAAAKAEREKQLAAEGAAAQPAPQQPAPQQPAPQQPAPQQPAPQQPAPQQPTAEQASDPYGTTQPVDSLPARAPSAAGAPQGQQPYPPPGAPQGQPYPPPGAPQGQQPYPPPGAPQGQPYPPPGAPQGQPYPPPGAPQGQQPYPPPGAPQGQPYPPPGAPPHAAPPQGHQRPPYLASETGTRMNAPIEPWADSLKKICTIFGALLLIAFVAPWAIAGSKMLFSWDMFDAPDTATKLIPILIAVSGAVALVLGLAPVSVTARGVGATAAGLAPLIFMAVGSFALFSQGGRGRASADFEWRLFVLLISLMGLATGFVMRSQYRSAALARIVCTVAAALIVIVYVVPDGGRTLVGDMIDTLTKAPQIEGKLFGVYMLLPMVLAVIGFAAWAPATTGMGARLWAWLALLWAPGLILGMFVIALGSMRGDIGDNIKATLMLAYHIPVAILAWYALSAYGLSTLLGKKLEHS